MVLTTTEGVTTMAKGTKLTVATAVGTFTRTTARTYTHIVVVQGERAELLEAERLADIKTARKSLAEHLNAQQDLAPLKGEWRSRFHSEWLAEGKYAEWAEADRARIAKREAEGVITQDSTRPAAVIGWSGRLDLARKVATSYLANRYRTVRIFDVATGLEAR
jgi:hypothetical protein